MSESLDITPSQMKTVRSLLKRYLPGVAAWAYGSRVKWTSRPESDLDLVVFATPEQQANVSALREAFEESNIPFRVDLFVWDEVPDKFRKTIKAERFVVREEVEKGWTKAAKWRKSKLGSCATFLSGGTPSKKNMDYWGIGMPWVSAKDMKYSRIHDAQDHVTELGVRNGTRIVEKGTTLLLVRGMTLHNDIPICRAECKLAFNQDVKAIVANDGVEGSYLYYWMLAQKPRLLGMVDSAGHGTGRLNTDQLKAMPFRLPLIEDQQSIARILGSLDDKIDLNRHMNVTLEAMARSIFKAWFIDFEPVKAKAAGATSFLGMPQDTFDQLPNQLTDSELGPIPEGWEVDSVGSVCVFNYGKALKASNRRGGEVPVYGSNGAVGWHDEALVSGPGIVVGRKGNAGTVTWIPTDFFAIDTTFYVSTNHENVNLSYLRYVLAYLRLDTHGSDSAVPGLNRNMAYSLPVIVPDPMTVRAFEEAFLLHQAMIYGHEKESRTLAAIRDALLPKLISGKIRVATDEGGDDG